MDDKLQRSEKRVKIDVLFNEVSAKVDKENGVGVYVKNMALFGGIGFISSLGAFSQIAQNNHFAFVALATVLTAGGVVAGMIKGLVDEKKQVNSLMSECIKDVATRDNLIPVEKVLLQRYLAQDKMNIKDVVKDNIIKTDLDLGAVSTMSTSELKEKVTKELSRYSKEQIAENIKYNPEYMREIKSEMLARVARISAFQDGLSSEPKARKLSA